MSDLKIYNNGENKVLMSAGDRIIRQAYEVAEGFNNDVTPKCWFESDEPLSANWGVLFYIGNTPIGASDCGILQAISESLNLADNVVIRSSTNLLNIIDSNSNFAQITFNPPVTRAVRFLHSGSSGITAFANGATLGYASMVRTESVRSRIKIGVSGAYINNSVGNQYYLNGAVLHRFIIVDRLLANSEVQYMHNNAIFAEPQSMQGLLNEYIFAKDTLQIVNYQGVDVVGMTDLIGDRTLKLMGLPAGSLQEQLDWARANLYKLFPN